MDSDKIALVETSFAQVAPIKDMAAELFYNRLFTIAPEVEPMFKGDMKAQGSKLMATLAVAVNGLRDLDALVPVIQDLAARHVTYGVTPKHYEPVGEALLWTLKQGLGDGYTPEVEAAWIEAYVLLSETMVASAYPKADPSAEVAAE
ncbi:MAG: globin family protein [Pseudomonadota bacterium]